MSNYSGLSWHEFIDAYVIAKIAGDASTSGMESKVKRAYSEAKEAYALLWHEKQNDQNND